MADLGIYSTEGWIAHDAPERPLAYGAWICDCVPCAIALQATVATNPGLRFVVKRGMGRDLVSGRDLLERGADSYCGPDDYVREVFVAAG